MSSESSNPLQATAKWLKDRVGCLTASQAYPVLVMGARGKPLKARTDLLEKLVAERLTGLAEESFCSAAMQWGIDHEEEARNAYLAYRGQPMLELTGFVRHPSIPHLGASPDGLIDDDGLVEIKCPNTTTHVRRIAEGVVPEQYVPQLLVQLLCTGRKWVDFVSYDPRLLERFPKAALWVIRFEPTAEQLADAEQKCREFLAEVDAATAKLLETVEAQK